MGIFSGCLVIILAFIIIGVIGSIVGDFGSTGVSGSPTGVAPKAGNHQKGGSSTVDLTARVRFTGNQIVVHNGDAFDWTNVKLEINSGLLSGGYVLNLPRMRAGEECSVGTMQFAKPNGERFNPFTHKPQKFTIWCDTMKGKGFYYGEWK